MVPRMQTTHSPHATLAGRLSLEVPSSLLDRLRARYDEPHRRYHTWEHVLACLGARARLTDAALPEVDLALLFHDAVYEPFATDNEARSAELLLDEGRRAWLDDRLLQRAQALVLATAHAQPHEDSPEACLVVDADLSILGADRETFDAYERAVRGEYGAIDDATFG